ncbi:MAG: CDP-glycerol glycerophosphotransferase family protein [Bacteroidetes bacterium]|nr:CDP-glycerol glycerophosphotransferase family protein [Bacteroidota bacterium]
MPRRKNLILFGSHKGMLFSDNTKYLFLRASDDLEVKAIWITRSKHVMKELQEHNFPCVYANSFQSILLHLRARTGIYSYGIFSDLLGHLLGGAHVVNTWHGVGLKKVHFAYSKSNDYTWYNHHNVVIRSINRLLYAISSYRSYWVFSTSPTVSSYYPETFHVKPKHVIELGQARNDVFYRNELVDTNKLPDMLTGGKTIITYMPTHRDDGKVALDIESLMNLQELNDICEKENCIFLIKTHFYASDLTIKNSPHIINFGSSQIDPQVLLKYTNILITDYSSCYTDFLLLDRPIVFFCYDYDTYVTSDRDMYYPYDQVTPGAKCRTYEELKTSLIDILSGRDTYSEERKRVLDVFYSPQTRGPVIDKQWNFIKSHVMRLQ